MSNYLKMYIAVLDEVPDYMVPTLVAHSVINAHIDQQSHPDYQSWLKNSYRKVTLRVSRKEFDKIKDTCEFWWEGHENTICNGEGSCLVVLPVQSDAVPNVLKFAKLWKPKED